jgi:hypothetical protein
MRMSTLRAAAMLFLVYATALLANASLYTSWSGDRSEWPRLLIRLVGLGAVAWGLWRRERWAWWLGVLLGGAFAAFGIVGLWAAHSTGLLDARPYPAADYAFFVVSIVALLSAVVLLLLPRSRAAARPAGQRRVEAVGREG